jgi:endo-alpha-1,4-polygalactosaminidase (GH114 family)
MEFREEATRKRETLEDELLEARSEHERFARDVRFKVREEMGAGRLRLPTGFHEEFMNLRDVLRKLEPVTKTEDWLLATAQFPAKGSAESMVAMKKLLEELEKSGKPIGELERRLGLTRQRESELPEREKRKRTGSADFDAVELGSVENWRQLVAAMRGQKIDEDKAKEETLKKVSDAVSAALPKFDAMITELKKGETPTVPIGAGG